MFPGNIGVSGLVIILIITLIIFGPKKLPEIGSAFGKTLSEFKKSANDIMSDNSSSTEKAEGEEKKNKKDETV
ncbi:twin-arginine translocase TatA/TatE family subunit [Bacillus piscicola]|uniref:twin-arginine translocase TatA/TatE family subunit n=1 Tax=Bacillus piscicola TaxID=1632684 RepID=UPI001F08964F|nr:twin-arginine translocase TatA/TatE family subunit [Bacillus piscicola]